MERQASMEHRHRYLLLKALLVVSPAAIADEGGVSFWLPGQFGSLAAVQGESGWSFPMVYYHTSVESGGAEELQLGGEFALGVEANADLVFVAPTYTFETPVFGAQAALGFIAAYGNMDVDADVTLTGPRGFTVESSPEDSVTSGSDLYSLGTLKWNAGANNFMAYFMAGFPVGSYEEGRLANIGINHYSFDAGGGYTYFNQKSGFEFSAVMGFTYNFENEDTDYQNGVDGHIDWAVSQFLSAQTHVGLVGYFYHQVSGDDGDGAVLGDFKSEVSALGPQVGYFFPVGKRKFYVNWKGYYEFDAANRPEGWNMWLSLLIPLEDPAPH